MHRIRTISITALLLLSVASGLIILIPSPEVSAQPVPEYQDASNGLPTQSLWVSKPEFFDLDDDGTGDLSILGPRKGPGDRSLHVFKWDGSSWSNRSLEEGTNTISHSSYGGLEYGDFNNDGQWDVGVGSHGADDVDAYLRSMGNSWLESSTGLQGSEDAYSIEVGDYNSDGNLDLLVGGFWGMDLKPYAGNGQGQWVEQSTGLERGTASNVEGYFCDINNDGDLDIIGNLKDGNWVYLGHGDGSWESSSEGLPQGSWGEGPDWGDFNNDGYVDIVMCVGDQTYAYEGDGTGYWADRSAGLPAYSYASLKLEDMNGDKNDDLVGLLADGLVELYLATGSGGWAKAQTTVMQGNAEGRRLNVGDFDHNGHRDIVAGFGTEEEQGSIRVWKESTIPTELATTVSYPDGMEYFKEGSIRFIRWFSAVPAATGTREVKLELSTEGNSGPWNLIIDSLPDTGVFQWTVPNEVSDNCYIRATVSDNQANSASDVSDNAFGIGRNPALNHDPEITILTPDENNDFADKEYEIEWEASDSDEEDTVTIDLYYDNDTNPDNGTSLIVEDLSNSGNYTWDISEMPEGDYFIYGVADDNNGSSAADYSEGMLNITHENQENRPPIIDITAPGSGGAGADDRYTIEWDASDQDDDVITVDLYYDTDTDPDNGMTLIASGLEDTGNHEWECSEIEEGDYYICGVADDNNGSSTMDHSEGMLNISHDGQGNRPPIIEITAPGSGSGSDSDSADDSFIIEWTASDEDQDDALVVDLFYDSDTDPENGRTLIVSSIEDTGSHEWNCSAVEGGDYYIYGIVDDKNGSTSDDYSNDFVTVSHPSNTPPEVEIDSPDDESTISGIITLRGASHDDDGDESIEKVEVKIGEGDWEPADGTTSWELELDTTGYADGWYEIICRAYDGEEYSDEGAEDAVISLEFYNPPPNAAPGIEINYPANGSTVKGLITISGEAHDENGDDTLENVEIKVEEGEEWQAAAATGRGTDDWTEWEHPLDTRTLVDGWHTINARAYDGEEYSGIVSIDLHVSNTEPNEPPEISFFASDRQKYKEIDTAMFSAEVLDPNGPDDITDITLTLKIVEDGSERTVSTFHRNDMETDTIDGSDGDILVISFSLQLTAFEPGDYSAVLDVSDSEGKSASGSSGFTVEKSRSDKDDDENIFESNGMLLPAAGACAALVMFGAIVMMRRKSNGEGNLREYDGYHFGNTDSEESAISCPACGSEAQYSEDEDDHYCWECGDYLGDM